jgi:thiamine transport system ATP-binding protein
MTLIVDAVGVRLGERWICPPQSFVVDNEIVALLGPSGSGKTTLLKVIAGLIAPTTGRVLIDNVDQHDVAVHRRHIGFVFQDHVLFNHLSVADNIAFGLRAAKWPKAQRQVRVDELLQLIKLDGAASQSVTTLSGGEAQRVAIARALAPRPKIVLADEPLASLDTNLRTALGDQMRELLKATATPAVIVTHDRAEATRVADRLINITPPGSTPAG